MTKCIHETGIEREKAFEELEKTQQRAKGERRWSISLKSSLVSSTRCILEVVSQSFTFVDNLAALCNMRGSGSQ